jgi:peptidoglycan/xylan/chitin deacetylase (PgdA/CDA1 family)
MRVTLTFDNGPDPDVTPRVLDVLGRRSVRAHFYVLGKWLGESARRRCVERAHAEGHIVGNHSFSHAVPLGDDPRPDAVAREIVQTETLLAPITGEKWFRPFGGAGARGPHLLSRDAVEFLTAHGYSCVLWNCVPRDWVEPDAWAARALAACAAEPHTVVVLHDIPNASLAALDGFIATLLDRGAELTLDVPAACLPIARGKVVGDLTQIVR